MFSFGSLASLASLIPIAFSLNVVSQDSLPKLSAKSPPDSFDSPLNDQHGASLNTSLTPAKPPPFAHNSSALIELGLDVNRSISWMTSASGNAIGVRMYTPISFLIPRVWFPEFCIMSLQAIEGLRLRDMP